MVEELEWKLPGLMHYPDDQPDYRTLCWRLSAEYTKDIGDWGDGKGILLEEAKMEILCDHDEVFGGPATRLERVGLDTARCEQCGCGIREGGLNG